MATMSARGTITSSAVVPRMPQHVGDQRPLLPVQLRHDTPAFLRRVGGFLHQLGDAVADAMLRRPAQTAARRSLAQQEMAERAAHVVPPRDWGRARRMQNPRFLQLHPPRLTGTASWSWPLQVERAMYHQMRHAHALIRRPAAARFPPHHASRQHHIPGVESEHIGGLVPPTVPGIEAFHRPVRREHHSAHRHRPPPPHALRWRSAPGHHASPNRVSHDDHASLPRIRSGFDYLEAPSRLPLGATVLGIPLGHRPLIIGVHYTRNQGMTHNIPDIESIHADPLHAFQGLQRVPQPGPRARTANPPGSGRR